jgi:hypothetical protein
MDELQQLTKLNRMLWIGILGRGERGEVQMMFLTLFSEPPRARG